MAGSVQHMGKRAQFIVGISEFFLRPSVRNSWFGALNGQDRRKESVLEIFGRIKFKRIIETGTYRGSTTKFFHETFKLPITTIEISPRFYAYSACRFLGKPLVSVVKGSSEDVLAQWIREKPETLKENTFFYLDAHWYEHLPLVLELELIFTHWPNAVVLIDDFLVPGDEGYAFDSYGPDKTLSQDFIVSVVKKFSVVEFFPTASSEEETGLRRGHVVLASNPTLVSELEALPSLRR